MAVVIEVEDDRLVASHSRSNSDGNDGDDDDEGNGTNYIMPKYCDATYAFIRAQQIDLYGNLSTVGMAVETHMVKHYEPCSDILDLTGSYASEN